jgi:hypothetical protein
MAKAFKPSFTSADLSWCTPQYNKQRPTGILYNKMPKAASSTTSGVALRIAKRVARRQFSTLEEDLKNVTKCSTRVDHIEKASAVGRLYGKRDRKKSFLFSTIRDPAKRAISRIFFSKVSAGERPTDENVLNWLNEDRNHQYGAVSPGLGGFQLAYVTMHPHKQYSAWDPARPSEVSNPDLVHQTVKEIMQDYDFMILVERYDESLVAMQLMLGLETSDILYLSSKHAGTYHYRIGRCVQLASSFVSRAVSEYLSSKEWYAKSYGDYLLQEAINQSLDLTIEAFGRERFDEALQNFLALKQQAEEHCAPEAVFPCSQEGEPQIEKAKSSCYQNDWGCGYPCLDNLTIPDNTR